MQEDQVSFAHRVFLSAKPGIGKGVVLYGAPLDITTSFKPGTRFGPSSIREMSGTLETYDMATGRDLANASLWDAGDVVLTPGALIDSLDRIKNATRSIIGAGGIPFMLGGEHLASLPVAEAVYEAYPDIAVIHMDAHADMRMHFFGQELTHAGVLRRIAMLIGRENVYQLGIRSASSDEIEFASKPAANFLPFDLKGLPGVVKALKGRPVYLTLDIDVLDPAYAPGTGAPEPGGVTTVELYEALALLDPLNLVAADLVEVAPAYDHSGITGLAAARAVRQVVLSITARRGK
jgi:agmatinase